MMPYTNGRCHTQRTNEFVRKLHHLHRYVIRCNKFNSVPCSDKTDKIETPCVKRNGNHSRKPQNHVLAHPLPGKDVRKCSRPAKYPGNIFRHHQKCDYFKHLHANSYYRNNTKAQSLKAPEVS